MKEIIASVVLSLIALAHIYVSIFVDLELTHNQGLAWGLACTMWIILAFLAAGYSLSKHTDVFE